MLNRGQQSWGLRLGKGRLDPQKPGEDFLCSGRCWRRWAESQRPVKLRLLKGMGTLDCSQLKCLWANVVSQME